MFAGLGLAGPLLAQLPIGIEEQVQIYNALPPAQRQALIREMSRQLPADEREAVLEALMGSRDSGAVEFEDEEESSLEIEMLAEQLATGGLGVETEPEDDGLRAGDTLVVEITLTDPAITDDQREALERINDNNPYVLDDNAELRLPVVPGIALAGLTVEQATVRVRTERQLRRNQVALYHLPLDPVGPSSLEPFARDIFRSVRTTFNSTTDIPVPADYVVGPGDSFDIQLFGSENSQFTRPVTRDGTISIPQIGPLTVAGLEFAEVRELVSERVSQQMIGVSVSVTLGRLRSIRVFVLGEVERPGSFTVSSLATMTNGLLSSRGVTEIGSLRRIALIRNGETVSTLDLYELMLRGDMRSNARLEPNDVIFVPPIGPTVAVDGEVRRPAIYELNGETNAAEIIELAGGLLADADPGSAQLERIVAGRGVSVVELDLAAAVSTTTLNDGDVIRVPRNIEQLEGGVRLVGNVQREGIYQWHEGMTIGDLLPGPELVRPQSDLRYVLIRREPLANVRIEVLSVDLEAVWERRPGAVDLALRPRDTVHVFHVDTGRQLFMEPIINDLESQAGPGEPLPVVRIGGKVRAEGEYPLEPGMRVSDLLRAGGGPTDAAYSVEAELTRYEILDGEYRRTDLVNVNLAEIRAGTPGADLPLSPYDYLSVREISGWGQQEVVTLRGEFRFPGDYPIRPGETIESVIDRAGGLTEFAFPEGSVFTRVDAAQRQREQIDTLARRLEADLATRALADEGSDALETGQAMLNQLRTTPATGRTVIPLDEIIAGRSETEIELRDGDVLMVPKRSQEVTVIGEVQYPTTHIFEAGIDRDAYVERSGGLTRRADDGRVYIVRANGEVVADSGGRWFRRDAGFEVRPGDTIVAPLDVTQMRPLTLWTSITQIMYSMAIAAAAVSSF